MGRQSRKSLLFDGCYAHVMSRAAEKRFIMRSDNDFLKLKELLLEAKQRFGFRIHHYCLMHTHFHLLVSVMKVKEFSEAVKWVKWNYARYFNHSEKRFGPLWRDRFKSRLIENERYLQACGNYVENNPVEAGLVRICEDWAYSSSRYYLNHEPDELVDAYCFDGEPVQILGDPRQFFEESEIIGSDLFKIQCEEGVFCSMPVPK